MDLTGQLIREGVKAGTGGFTVDLEAAARKLATVAALEPGLMLGRLVQAATTGSASQLRFSVTSDRVEARLFFGDSATDPLLTQEHLRQALALGLAQKPVELSWECGARKLDVLAGDLVLSAQQEVQAEPIPVRGTCWFRFQARSKGIWETLFGGLRRRGNYHSFLSQRTLFSPIPVYLDACRVNLASEPRREFFRNSIHLVPASLPSRQRLVVPSPMRFCAGFVHLGGQVYEGEMPYFGGLLDVRKSGEVLVLRGVEKARVKHTRGADPKARVRLTNKSQLQSSGEATIRIIVEEWQWEDCDPYLSQETTPSGEPLHLSADTWISRGSGRHPAELFPVVDGLLLNPVVVSDLPPATRIVAVGSGMQTDLEGLNVLQNDQFQSWLSRIKQWV